MKQLYVTNRDEWNMWLSEHHHTEREVWLVFFKKETKQPSIEYESAVEEALCFGWIDSVVKKIDDSKYARKFTPRKDKSNWSELNKKRAEKMIKEISARIVKDVFNEKISFGDDLHELQD